MKLEHNNNEEPFSNTDVWGLRPEAPRPYKGYEIQKVKDQDGNPTTFWRVDGMEDQTFTDLLSAQRHIDAYHNQNKETNINE